MVRPVIAPDASINPPALFKTQANKRILPNPNPAVAAGLLALVETHPSNVAKMLNAPGESAGQLVDRIAGVMAVNSLSAEAVLARFFSGHPMSEHLAGRLGKSGKGNPATLAARIVAQWRPGPVDAKKRKSRGSRPRRLRARPSPRRTPRGPRGGKPMPTEKRRLRRRRRRRLSLPARGPPARRASPAARARAHSVRLCCAHARWLARRPDGPAVAAGPGASGRRRGSRRGVALVLRRGRPRGGRHRGRRVLASLRVAGRSAHRELAHAPGHQARRGPDTASVSRKRAGRGRRRRAASILHARAFFFAAHETPRHAAAAPARLLPAHQAGRDVQGGAGGGCPLCCGDEIFLLTLEQRDGLSAKSGRSFDAKPPTLCVPGTTRALPRHRLRCDSWTECHCDGTTKRFDEEVDVGYVMDGVGPVDVAAHLRTGKAK